ncbi:epoxide hydrolase [Nocardia sp. NBC_00565]|uniref:epoxide hydrolase family protein n=1 Tax=Nocardia sp. NBC_00565 TaxID=2975993 RepID=UPI002E808A31|nr:epoxide hydrolase family protein [Nocardia sp. NBC_00565]WUC01434.1 epoxide hydrolase [Nocardia sp. NBC_00565]
MNAIRPFSIDIPQDKLDDLADRLHRTLWPNELPGVGDSYGVPGDRVRALAEYWLDSFDWRALEAKLNSYPQFTTEIDGENIYFLHIRSARADALPVILTHGWPGSVLEYLDVIELLTAPESADAPAFHVVIPALPGIGFAGPTHSTGWTMRRVAQAWIELMDRLGYDRFGAIGNDGGSMVSPEIGRLVPDRVVGVHVTQLFSFPSGDPAEFESISPADLAALEHLKWFQDNKMAFNILCSQQPQTLAYAISDSPVGLLGWNAQLFGESLDAEFVVGNVALYWLTGTAGSSVRFYYEQAHSADRPTGPTTAPTALAMFKGDFQSMRRFAERDHRNIVSWNSYDSGSVVGGPNDAAGHFAAHEAPELLIGDIRRFFAKLS